MATYIFTSESVSEGHPDKIADQISDAILDALIEQDPRSRVACETLIKTGYVNLAGEITTNATVNYADIVRKTIRDIGYDDSRKGFDADTCGILVALDGQSDDIAMGVDSGDNKDEGAGDQGLMFGYACRETDVLMPAAIHYSHQILKRLAEVRKADAETILGPDSKSQITLVYGDDGKPTGTHKVVLSTQHAEAATQSDIRKLVTPLIAEVLPDGWMVGEEDLLVDPTGNFVIGGPDGDAGLTGRKIIVDTYGGAAPHGGGAFSGKDPTKVDRSAAYAARYLAKNVVAAGLAERCTIQIAYAIGVAEPVSVYADTHGTGTVDNASLEAAIAECMPLTPRNIREHLGLNKPIYAPSAAYGHFGRVAGEAGPGSFSWETVDLADKLAAAV